MRPMTHRMTSIDRLMPEAGNAGRRTRAAVVRAAGAMLVALALQVGCIVAGVSDGILYDAVVAAGFLSTIAVLALRAATATHGRLAWCALTAAVGLWIAGTAVDTAAGAAAGTLSAGPADVLWLLFYPCAYLAVVFRARATVLRMARSVRMA